MKVFRGTEVTPTIADSHSFVGHALTQKLAAADDGTPVVIYRVEFDSGARTNWHTHSGPQWLLVVEGRIRLQKWGEPAIDISAGDAAVIAPGEKHWHGATPRSRAVHLAVNINFTTEWHEAVTEQEYLDGEMRNV
jgi:quercetin dioxygenase-like cupin family protein